MTAGELLAGARAPVLAFVVTLLAAAALARLAPRIAGLAASIGLAAGLFDLVGVRLVTPRLLPERLPWLVLGASLLGAAAEALGRRWAARLAVLGAVCGTWWMLGAPRHGPDLVQVAAEAPAVVACFLLAAAPWGAARDAARPEAARGTGHARPVALLGVAAAATAVVAWLGGMPPLVSALALATAAAAAGLLAARPRTPQPCPAALLPLAAGLGGAAATAWLSVGDPLVRAAVAAPLVAHGLMRARQ